MNREADKKESFFLRSSAEQFLSSYITMSLNKFTVADPVKKWMNIGCNSLKVGGFAIGNAYASLSSPDDTPIPQAVSQYPLLTRITPQTGTYQTNDAATCSRAANGIQVNVAGTYAITVVIGYSQDGTSSVEYLGNEEQEVFQSLATDAGQIYVMSYHRVSFLPAGRVVSPWMASSDAGQTLDITSTIIRVNRLS